MNMTIGNLEKRGENRYRLTVSGGYSSNGKRIKHRKTITAKNDKEASKQLALFISEIEKGDFISLTNLTFSDFVERWISDYAETNLEAKTLYRYQYLLRDNILPIIGDVKLERIKPMHLLNLYKAMSLDGARKDGKSGGYSTKTIRHAHTLVRSILEKAVQWQLISQNPASRVEPPKVKENEISFYDGPQLSLLLKLLKDEPIKYQALICTAIFTGIRRGEIVGLKWEDINFEESTIYIRRAAIYIPKKGIITKSTKTIKSQRKIWMTETLKKVLSEYKDWQNKTINLYGDLWIGDSNVFTQENGAPIHPDTISQWFAKFIKNHNLPPITLHGLRHSNATLLLNTGTDIETVSRILGHATSATTSKVYLHSTLKARSDAMVRLEDNLTSKE